MRAEAFSGGPHCSLLRLVASGIPHHVTQHGNRREAIFFEDGDQEIHAKARLVEPGLSSAANLIVAGGEK